MLVFVVFYINPSAGIRPLDGAFHLCCITVFDVSFVVFDINYYENMKSDNGVMSNHVTNKEHQTQI